MGFQKLSTLAPVTMMALGNPQIEGETDDEYAERITELLNKEKVK